MSKFLDIIVKLYQFVKSLGIVIKTRVSNLLRQSYTTVCLAFF